jgi:hypothetical protein
MSRLRVNAFEISIDGYGAGPEQALDNPMGVGGMALHQWVFGTKTFQKIARGFDNLGAWIKGRNMFASRPGRKPPRRPIRSPSATSARSTPHQTTPPTSY